MQSQRHVRSGPRCPAGASGRAGRAPLIPAASATPPRRQRQSPCFRRTQSARAAGADSAPSRPKPLFPRFAKSRGLRSLVARKFARSWLATAPTHDPCWPRRAPDSLAFAPLRGHSTTPTQAPAPLRAPPAAQNYPHSLPPLSKGGPEEREFAEHLRAHLSIGSECRYSQPKGRIWGWVNQPVEARLPPIRVTTVMKTNQAECRMRLVTPVTHFVDLARTFRRNVPTQIRFVRR